MGQGDDCTENSEAVVDQDIGTMMERGLVKPAGADKLMGLWERC